MERRKIVIEKYINKIKELLLFEKGQFFSIQTPTNYFPARLHNSLNYKDVSIKDIIKHYKGEHTISIQPIQYGTNLCKYGAIDFDTNDTTVEGLQILLDKVRVKIDFIKTLNINHYVEYSGKKGFHIYFFSDKPIPSVIMRNFLRYVCINSNYHTDEIYPNADYISHTYYPKPLKLFYGIHRKTNARSGFIDIDNVVFKDNIIDISSNFDILYSIQPTNHEVFYKYQSPIEIKNYINKPIDWSKIPNHHPPCISKLLTDGACIDIDYNKNNLTLARYVADRMQSNPNMSRDYLIQLANTMAKASSNHPTSKLSVEDKVFNMTSILNSSVWVNYRWKCSFVWSSKSLAKSCGFCPLNPKAYGIKEEGMLLLEIKSIDEASIDKPLVNSQIPNEYHSTQDNFTSFKENAKEETLVKKDEEPTDLIYTTSALEFIETTKNTALISVEVIEENLFFFAGDKYFLLSKDSLELIKDILEGSIIKISSDIKKLSNLLYYTDVDLNSYFDITLAYNLSHAGIENTTNLSTIFTKILGVIPDYTLSYSLNDLRQLASYMKDYCIIRKELIALLQQHELIKCFLTELAHIKVSSEIESTGFLFDKDKFEKLKKIAKDEIDYISNKLKKYDMPFEDSKLLLSSLQGKGYPYKDLSEDHLLEFNQKIPGINLFLKYRKALYKLSKFSSNIFSYVRENGRIHTHVNQLGTVTGRITTSEYCTVNFPKGSFRECFIAQEDYFLLDVDFKLQEIIILAQECQDPLLIEALNNDIDIHSYVAALILNKHISEVDPLERNLAKSFVYGFSYAVGIKRIKRELQNNYGIIKNEEEVKAFRESFYNIFKKIKYRLDYINKMQSNVTYITSLSGRKRFYKDNTTPSYTDLVNNPIQMCAVDIFKTAACNIYYYIKEQNYRAFFVNEIYDQLTLEVHKDDVEDVKNLVQQEMRKAAKIFLKDIYMDVSVSISKHLT